MTSWPSGSTIPVALQSRQQFSGIHFQYYFIADCLILHLRETKQTATSKTIDLGDSESRIGDTAPCKNCARPTCRSLSMLQLFDSLQILIYQTVIILQDPDNTFAFLSSGVRIVYGHQNNINITDIRV